MKNCICILLALLVMATGDSVVMAAADNPGDKAQNDLITAYVAAVNAKDMEKLKAVIHPKCLAEITDDNREMVSKILAGEFKDTIPADYKVVVTPVRKDQIEGMKGFATFPVEPSDSININWFPQENSLRSRMIFVVKEGGKWLMVSPIPTPETVQRFRAQQTAPKKP